MVTGAGTGIGRAAGQGLATDGFALVLVGRRREPLDELCGELRATGAEAIVAVADVGIDALVNNAGVGDSAALLDETLESWESTLRTNLNGLLAGPGWTSCCGRRRV